MNGRYWVSLGIAIVVGVAMACGSEADAPTATPSPPPSEADEPDGHALFLAKGCASCHGENAEGSTIAPALAGHTETQVRRQVRNPRFKMPAFTPEQISDDELEAIAHFITGLEGAGHAHAEPAELDVAVEMHHWMALDALKAGTREDALHHVGHIIELLEEGEHQSRMEAILVSLRAGETHDPEHDIEEMVAGTAAPDLTLAELHLRQALVALAVEDLADTVHHVEHFRQLAGALDIERAAEILELIEQRNLHDAEDEIQELLGAGEHEHGDEGAEPAGTLVDVNLEDPGGSGSYAFGPSELVFSVGDTVTFKLTSEAEFHTFTVDELGIDVSVIGNEQATLTFTFQEPGTFELICIPHETLGMVGTITVR
ncbi:MAG: c-type cytochrome [Chloroflexi bacterium]|nr:c-type cytochrome [Chloroflexota bacterium]